MSSAERQLPATVAETQAWIEGWLARPPLAELVRAFDGVMPAPGLELIERLNALEEFSKRWDFRGGRERNLVASIEFPPPLAAQILAAADDLGLVGENQPARHHYTHVVILGGLMRACLSRPMHAARLLDSGVISAPNVVALGGFRPLNGSELELARTVVDDQLSDEFEAMLAGVRRAFGFDGEAEHLALERHDSDQVGASWAIAEFRDVEDHGLPRMFVLVAPSSQPGVRRANTADTYSWIARAHRRAGELRSEAAGGPPANDGPWLRCGDDVLLITTDIYRVYQHADALRMLTLPRGVHVDVVGVNPGGLDPRLARPFAPHDYLQELRSTIRAMRMLAEQL